MKILATLILLFAAILPAQTLDDYEAAYPGLDFALHSAFIKCYVDHWRGTVLVTIKGSSNDVKMTCNGFWGKFVTGIKNPIGADQLPSPFEIIEHGPVSLGTLGIPFSVWTGYLGDTLAMSADNPLRKRK